MYRKYLESLWTSVLDCVLWMIWGSSLNVIKIRKCIVYSYVPSSAAYVQCSSLIKSTLARGVCKHYPWSPLMFSPFRVSLEQRMSWGAPIHATRHRENLLPHIGFPWRTEWSTWIWSDWLGSSKTVCGINLHSTDRIAKLISASNNPSLFWKTSNLPIQLTVQTSTPTPLLAIF